MAGHPVVSTTAPLSRFTTVKPKPNSYDDQSFGDLDFGSQGAASGQIDNVYRVPAPQNILDQYQVKTKLPYDSYVASYTKTLNNFGEGGAYTKLQARFSTSTPRVDLVVDDLYKDEAPLTGPMVVKVYPDGTPVKDKAFLPQDDDLNQYKLSKVKLPSY